MLLALLTTGAAPARDRWYLSAPGPALSEGPLLGAVADTSIRVWARSSSPARLVAQVRPTGQSGIVASTVPVTLAADHDLAGVVEVDGLAPATTYEYRVLLDGLDAGGGTFRTLPARGQPAAFRFALGGDLAREFEPFTILDRLREQQPAFSLLLGDLIYADQPAPIPASIDAYLEKYRANWSDASFARLTRTVPSFMMWDDHEIVNDYDGGTAGPYAPARAALDDYVANVNPPVERPGQLYYSFRVADVEFFVLDTRTYRSRDAQPDGPGKTLLGAQQKADLKAWLAASRAPFKIILSSVAFHDFGQLHGDCWTAFATERAELLDYVRQHALSGVVILSGDQHWSSLVRHDPYNVWEFNATPLAQAVIPPPPTDDPRLVFAYSASPAFGIVDVDTTRPVPTMTFRVIDQQGQERAAATISAGPP